MGESFFPLFADIDDSASWGQILMQAALYGYILSIGADQIGDGAELLLLCPKYAPLVGSIVVPILGAVPDGMMVLCSGLGDDAQEQIKVGVGALAGSTTMLLTLPWFLSIYTGRVTMGKDGPIYKPGGGKDKLQEIEGGTLAKVFGALFQSGVGVHDQVKANAKIMFLTTLPFLVIQIPSFMYDRPDISMGVQRAHERTFAILSGVLCILLFIFYMVKMLKDAQQEGSTVQDQIIKKAVEGIQTGQMTLRGAMHDFREATMAEMEGSTLNQTLLNNDGAKATETVKHMCKVLEPFFKTYDQNGDNQINIYEFKSLMSDLRENVSENKMSSIFKAADMDQSGGINFEEFVACIMAFALDPAQSVEEKAEDKAAGGDDDDDGDEEEDLPPDLADLSPAEQQAAIKKRACMKMLGGSLLVCAFSDPMVDLLGTMGNKLGVEVFYIGFLIAPLASNASELVSAMKMATKKTQSSMKESLSCLCGAAIMNNTFTSLFLFICFVWKGLVWKFSAETISIVLIQYIVGTLALIKTNHLLFDGLVILSLYPAAMGIVWCLKNYLHMD